MITFHDYDPANPFAVTGETQTIADGKVILNYTPLQGSVSITGFTETTSKTPAKGEFYIDYSAGTEYRMATQVVVFNTADNGTTVTASYSGVSTLIRAKHFNEIKGFMESVPTTYADKSSVTSETTARTDADSALDKRITAVESAVTAAVTSADAINGEVV